jgi:hypothetical protein
MGPVVLKLFRQPFSLVQWSHFPGAIRHVYDEGDPADVTADWGASSSEAKSGHEYPVSAKTREGD